MKCNQCNYDDNGTGDFAHRCTTSKDILIDKGKSMKHKWYNEIIAFAEGKIIQYKGVNNNWIDENSPYFHRDDFEFRVKPEIKLDVIKCVNIQLDSNNQSYISVNNDQSKFANLILTFDGETKKLKLVEIVE